MQFSRCRIAPAALAVLTVAAAAAAQQTTQLKIGGGGSPHVRTEWVVEGAKISVEYGRPSVKGRKIFGGLEPLDSVWRLGADEATTITTDKALVFGDTIVPAGTYTLWALVGDKAWKLIVNRKTGVWGVPYTHEKDELARIDMKKEPTKTPIEQLTLSIDRRPGGGVFAVEWDTTRASVPFSVKK